MNSKYVVKIPINEFFFWTKERTIAISQTDIHRNKISLNHRITQFIPPIRMLPRIQIDLA